MQIEVNFIAVIAAAIAYMALGFAWYSPALFGKQWMALRGLKMTKEDQAKMGPLYGLTFIASLLTAYVLFFIMAISEPFYMMDPIPNGLMSAFWVWLGFVMPTQVGNAVFGSDNPNKWKILRFDTSYQLVGLLLMGTVIGFLG